MGLAPGAALTRTKFVEWICAAKAPTDK
jgi:hypothetical protein